MPSSREVVEAAILVVPLTFTSNSRFPGFYARRLHIRCTAIAGSICELELSSISESREKVIDPPCGR